MTQNLCKFFILCGFLSIVFVSCTKKSDSSATPQTCLLASVSNAKGNVLEKFTYDANNHLIKDTSDSTGITFDYTYNSQSLVSKIVISGKGTSGAFSYSVNFVYNTSGQIQKATIDIQGSTYQTNVYTYTNSQITTVTTTDYQGSVLTTRMEYTGDNISKAFQKIDSGTEYLYYEAPKFDDKVNLYPEAYRSLGLGMIGIIDGYSYISKNNATTEKYYNSVGAVGYLQDNTFEYNSTSQPTKVTQAINNGGVKGTLVNTYQYNCK